MLRRNMLPSSSGEGDSIFLRNSGIHLQDYRCHKSEDHSLSTAEMSFAPNMADEWLAFFYFIFWMSTVRISACRQVMLDEDFRCFLESLHTEAGIVSKHQYLA
jgi:hypothetical protein